MRVGYADSAVDDLVEIRQFIGADNPLAASRVLTDIFAAANGLAAMPSKGRAGRVPGTRELVVAPYVIVYTVVDGDLIVLRVLHGARKWP